MSISLRDSVSWVTHQDERYHAASQSLRDYRPAIGRYAASARYLSELFNSPGEMLQSKFPQIVNSPRLNESVVKWTHFAGVRE